MDHRNPPDDISFAQAHPNAQKLMKEEFFYSPIDETAPFGSDDGWETFYAFKEWLGVNNGRNKVEFIHEQIEYWGYPPFNLYSTRLDNLTEYLQQSDLGSRFLVGTDQVIVATAFAQLYLQGILDLNLRSLAATAVKRQLELLNLWPDESGKRREQLLKLLSVLDPSGSRSEPGPAGNEP